MVNNCELDVMTGEVIHEVTDLYLPSLIPVQLTRRYVSARLDRGIFGWGWVHNFVPSACFTEDTFTKRNPIDGDVTLELYNGGSEKVPRLRYCRRNEFESGGELRDARGDQPASADVLVVDYLSGTREVYVSENVMEKTWLLWYIQDRCGNRLTYEYENGRVWGLQTPEGLHVQFAYESSGLLTNVAVIANDTHTRPLIELGFNYNGSRDLIAYWGKNPSPWCFTYEDHLIVSSRPPGGVPRYFFYSKERRCIASYYEGDLLVRALNYDQRRHNVVVADSYGRRTLFRFNEAGVMLQHVDALGQVTERILDGSHRLVATIAPDGTVVGTSRFDPQTNLLIECDALGNEWQRKIDELGNLLEVTSPSSTVEKREYDSLGRLTKLVLPTGGVSEIGYDDMDNLSWFRDPLGYEIQREVSGDGQHIRLIDRYGLLQEQHLDPLGNLVFDRDGGGLESQYEYTTLDVLSSESNVSGAIRRFEYDSALNLISDTDPLGNRFLTEYNGFGQIRAEIDPTGGRIEYEYDREGNLTRILNEKGETFEIRYDDLYREIQTKYFDDKVRSYDRDVRGRRAAITFADGVRVQLTYEGDGSIATRLFPDGTSDEYRQTSDGQPASVTRIIPQPGTEIQSSVVFDFNANSKPVTERGDNTHIEYEWDLCNNLVLVRDSFGDETRYVRGSRYTIETVVDLGREYRLAYLPTGELTEIVYPNGLRQRFLYDGTRRMIERMMVSTSGDVLTRRRFTYDPADRLIEVDDSIWGLRNYRYDGAERLRGVYSVGGQTLETYEYDLTGNIVRSPLILRAIVGEGNRVVEINQDTLFYDAEGNLIARTGPTGDWRYEWDRDGQLYRVFRDGNLIATYNYDVVNRRASKTTSDGTISFLYETYSLRTEVFSDGSRAHYVYLPGLQVPFAQCIKGEFFYYGHDQIGTPVEIFNEAGELIRADQFHAYGGQREVRQFSSQNVHFPFGFMGQYRDDETGLCYNHFRYYDPSLCRFISQDPLGIRAGTNFYTYPPNPNQWVDLLGLLVFNCLPHWDKCKQAYARAKIDRVNETPKERRKKQCTCCRSGAQRRDYKGKKCGKGKPGRGRQIDHMHELQAGGSDRCCNNLRAVPKNFNNELGRQTKQMLGKVDAGDVIPKVTLEGCDSKEPCTEEEMNRLAKPPPVNGDCDPKDDKHLSCDCS
jgi:RHS repeat-associated protein